MYCPLPTLGCWWWTIDDTSTQQENELLHKEVILYIIYVSRSSRPFVTLELLRPVFLHISLSLSKLLYWDIYHYTSMLTLPVRHNRDYSLNGEYTLLKYYIWNYACFTQLICCSMYRGTSTSYRLCTGQGVSSSCYCITSSVCSSVGCFIM